MWWTKLYALRRKRLWRQQSWRSASAAAARHGSAGLGRRRLAATGGGHRRVVRQAVQWLGRRGCLRQCIGGWTAAYPVQADPGV